MDIFKAFDTFDPDVIAPYLDDEFVNYLYPASLGGRVRKRPEWLEWFVTFPTTRPLLRFEILDLVEGKDATTVHVRNNGHFDDGSPYAMEYMILFRFRNKKVLVMKEFVDSEYLKMVAPKLESKTG